MSRRSVLGFVAASLLALCAAGCPSAAVLDAKDPVIDPVGSVEQPKPARPSPREVLAQNRARHLDELHAYWTARAFPINDGALLVANVFRDEDGNLCAVANMINRDGEVDLIDATARDHNSIRLADVHDGPLYDWILTSGFTQEEVAMIQVPYMPIQRVTLEEERARVASRLEAAEARLRDDTPQSLGVAMQRLDREHAARLVVAAR